MNGYMTMNEITISGAADQCIYTNTHCMNAHKRRKISRKMITLGYVVNFLCYTKDVDFRSIVQLKTRFTILLLTFMNFRKSSSNPMG